MVPRYSTPFFRTMATKLFICLINAFKGFLLGSNEITPVIVLLTHATVYKSYEQQIKRRHAPTAGNHLPKTGTQYDIKNWAILAQNILKHIINKFLVQFFIRFGTQNVVPESFRE